ncbi:SusC/RagA family TonB-linked outer membrane protein [Algoriphagus boritolerans]|uniref:TonB-linked outer membrane protein, SusC/RagA family n=2 Tax=Algoriphagus TaxID=246875 RepID=A0A1H6AP43_9BACT|nr:TonB-dependent receptor [Algoriphagus boritolerans]SEG50493.1 TonB-linked outer membrane protein, SusC/RagA family [Algoriphagus boritolerans DSM 17298 = JCM 18970]
MEYNLRRQLIMLSKRLIYAFVFQLVLCTVIFANTGIAQRKTIEEVKVSLNLKEKSLTQFFKQVESKTDFKFTYTDNLVDLSQAITVVENNKSLYDILVMVSMQTQLNFVQVNENIHVKAKKENSEDKPVEVVQKADINVKGVVKDATGQPLPGVTVLVKGTTTGTVTELDGSYTLTAPEGAVLVFSFVGYEVQEITIGNQSIIDVTLQEDETSLEEVVVIGYGTQKKSDLTGAIASVSGAETENQAVASVAQALQGKVAGLNIRQTSGSPGAGAEIRIRGMGSFGANSSPLVVVDGVITNRGLMDMDPSNIESVTVLKDATSAAIYGSRGANGVVLITTKRGKAGREKISFQSFYSFDQVINKIETVDADTYEEMVNDFYGNQGLQVPYPTVGTLGVNTNWQDEVFRTGGKQNYSFSMSGGTEKNLHAITLSYYKGEGIVVNSEYSRVNFRVNNDIKPIDGLKIGSSFGFSYGMSRQGDPNGATSLALIYAPNVRPFNEDGSYGIADRAGQPTTMTQPLVAAYEPVNDDNRIGLIGNLYAEYEIVSGLMFKTSVGAEYINLDSKNFNPSYNFGLGNINGIATLNRNISATQNVMIDNIFSYNKSIGNSHKFDLLAGYTFQKERFEFVRAFRNTFSRNDSDLQVLDAATANDIARGNYTEWALQSYLGRVNYSFKDKYLLSSSIRIDQSSRFAKGNRTGVFPSLSAGWVLSNEEFLNNNLGQISYLKLRTGFGVLGNQDVGIYPYQSVINPTLAYSMGMSENVLPGAAPTEFANQNISWEKTKTIGAGLEVNLFQDQLGFVLDYYDRITTDVLVRVPLPFISGLATFPYQNVGSVRNNGIEFTVDYRKTGVNSDYLSYNIGFNITVNKNEVTKLDSGLDIIQAGGGQGGVETRTTQGYGINSFFGHIHDGIFQSPEEISNSPFQPNAAPGDIKFKDLNDDGVINAQDRTYIGSFLPKQIIGFNSGMKYKNFDLSVSVTGDFGRDQNIFARGFAAARAAEATNIMWADRWTGPGTSNYVPRIIGGDPNGNSRSSDFWIRSQNYVRVQNIQLGYNFSTEFIKKVGLEKMRIYVAGQNLFTITDFPGFDPETSATAYPIPRSVFAGLNLGF